MERNVYLKLMEVEEARHKWLEAIDRQCAAPGSEKIDLVECAGRVCSKPVFALRSSPAFHGAAMDGYAVKAEDTFLATPRKPIKLEIGSGAWAVNTGQPLPVGTNAVVMIEDVNEDGSGSIILEKAVFPWQNVRKTGEDIVSTEVILPTGTLIGPQELGALAAGGILKPEVFRKARVTIIPSGSDLVPFGEAEDAKLNAGKQLPEFNSLVFSAMIRASGAEALVMPIVPDDPEAIMAAVEEASRAGADLILINAGTSAGSHDYSASVLSRCGEVLVHGVNIMPGKPVVLGIARMDGKNVPVAGIPGYPVSAWVAMDEFILPLLAHWQGRVVQDAQIMEVRPVNALPSRPGMEERLRVRLGVVDGKAWAVPLPRGAGTVTSLSRADAIISVPPESEGLNAGELATAKLLKSRSQVEGALLAIGSHDNTLELLDSLLRSKHARFSMTSAHVGSQGGLLALSRGQAHLAGSHLLDPATGIYNKAAISKFLPHTPVTLIRLVGREQGLILAPGNPLDIQGLEDLKKTGVRFINRQKGSGTRVLLDWKLAGMGLDKEKITGYADEEYTHMNIAQAVLSGRADAGLGVRAAANALGLDFIPVGNEEYDLVIPQRFMEDERIVALLEVIRSQEFKKMVDALGGYDTSKTGEVIWEYGGQV